MTRAAALVLLAMATINGEDAGLAIPGIPDRLHWKIAPASWKLTNGELTITAGRTTDWYTSPVDRKVTANAPVALFQPAADFVLTAKVRVDFETKWDAGFLMVYVNDGTWAKFALEMAVYKEPTLVTVVTRGVSDDANSISISGNSVWLRIARTGQAIGFYASSDGRSFRMIRAFTLGDAAGLRAGFGAQSPVGEKSSAMFSEITYSPRKIKDIFTGE